MTRPIDDALPRCTVCGVQGKGACDCWYRRLLTIKIQAGARTCGGCSRMHRDGKLQVCIVFWSRLTGSRRRPRRLPQCLAAEQGRR